MNRLRKMFKCSATVAPESSVSNIDILEKLKKEHEILEKELKEEKEKRKEIEQLLDKMRRRFAVSTLECVFSEMEIQRQVEKNENLEKTIECQNKKLSELQKQQEKDREWDYIYDVLSRNSSTSSNFQSLLGLLKTEKEQTKKYRKKMLYAYKQLKEVQEKSDETTKPWKMCEICDTEYGEAATRVPRVLACGHTICHTCATKLANSEYLRCPFDRKCTDLTKCTLESLPKNFTVLHM